MSAPSPVERDPTSAVSWALVPGVAVTTRLHRAATIYDMMLADRDCGVILCLAGSLVSAGLRQTFVDLIKHDMVDAVVSTGTEPPAGSEEKGQRLLAALQPFLAAPASQVQVPEQRSPVAGERTGRAPAVTPPDESASGRTGEYS